MTRTRRRWSGNDAPVCDVPCARQDGNYPAPATFPGRQVICVSLDAAAVARRLRGVRHLRPAGPVDSGYCRLVAHAAVSGSPVLRMPAFAAAIRPCILPGQGDSPAYCGPGCDRGFHGCSKMVRHLWPDVELVGLLTHVFFPSFHRSSLKRGAGRAPGRARAVSRKEVCSSLYHRHPEGSCEPLRRP